MATGGSNGSGSTGNGTNRPRRGRFRGSNIASSPHQLGNEPNGHAPVGQPQNSPPQAPPPPIHRENPRLQGPPAGGDLPQNPVQGGGAARGFTSVFGGLNGPPFVAANLYTPPPPIHHVNSRPQGPPAGGDLPQPNGPPQNPVQGGGAATGFTSVFGGLNGPPFVPANGNGPPLGRGGARGTFAAGAGRGNVGCGSVPPDGPLGRGQGLRRGNSPLNGSIEALLASEARRLMPVLHPIREDGALWFGSDNEPRRVIVAAIRRHFDGPWFNISSVPNETIVQWWGEFIQSFYWEPAHGADVYSYWYHITAARLRDMVSKARNGAERPAWISPSTWETMWSHWNSPTGRRWSRIAANNRLSNRDGYGPHAHIAGSRSFLQVREHMRRRNGTEPTMLDVLRKTHRRPDGSYVDARARSIDEQIQREIVSAEDTTPTTLSIDEDVEEEEAQAHANLNGFARY